MRKMRAEIDEAQATDRKQINDGLQQLREAIGSSISTLDEKVNDYIDEVNGRLKALADLIAHTNEISLEKKKIQIRKTEKEKAK